MGLWPKRAAEAVADTRSAIRASETFPPSTATVYDLTTGNRVAVSGVYDYPVSRELAMSVPAVLRGVTLLATTVAGLPIDRIDAEGRRVDLGWIDQPEAGRPRFATFNDICLDLIFDGKSYLYAPDRDASGAPRRGTVQYIALTRLGTVAKPNGTQGILIDGREVEPRHVIGFEGWHDGIRNHGARLIRTALAVEAQSRRLADSPMPSVALVNVSDYDLDDTEADELIADFKTARNQEAVAYLNKSVELKTMGYDAAQQQLVERSQYLSTQIANLVGVPAHTIAGAASMGGGTLTYQNVMQENRSLLDYGVKNPARAIESRLSLDDVSGRAWSNQVTPRGTTVRFDLDAMLRGNPIERAQLYQILIPLGVLTVEEARAREDIAPTGGNPS